MKHGTSSRRQRGRGNGGRRGNQQRSQVFDSNGPDVRIRGTAYQVAEKYLALAKDAESVDDKILAQSYLQHAEHYQRLINSWENEDHPGGEKRTLSPGSDGNENSHEDDLSLPSSIVGKKHDPERSKEEPATA